ncbi:MAG: DNA photolyase family protein [Gammaproteobacteria bacterium]|nr:DNA photolyase family protein [Gammaproteobacteria bacterium]
MWFRQDLRLADNPALHALARDCEKIIAVFIDDPAQQTVSRLGSASRVWLHHSLIALNESLAPFSGKLLVTQGPAEQVLKKLVADTGAARLHWNRCYDPVTRSRDESIKEALSKLTEVQSFNALLLREPWELTKDDGTPYRVFTPFWRKLEPHLPGKTPLPRPRNLTLTVPRGHSAGKAAVCALELLPSMRWDRPMMEQWQPGEQAATRQLKRFVAGEVGQYAVNRNVPGVSGTSRLSPHLHFGEISARQAIHHLYQKCADVSIKNSDSETWAREIGWREFASHLLFHFPQMIEQPLDKRFRNFRWGRNTAAAKRRWQQGQTGVPIVDAGMRELWHTGWMHNRVRMIVGSYLIKNLLVPWQQGEQWFRDTLVDADLASNVMGWQWVAGCGADAAPFFRVFNPVLQGEKFDPQGDYVRRWVPELEHVPERYLHQPWELPAAQRPADYPAPLVDLKSSRQRALMAFEALKKAG